MTAMPNAYANRGFETQPCSRCGGTGWHSHCEAWGDTCFQCGLHPGERGLGRYLTRRGRAARDYYLSLLPKVEAHALKPGDCILRDRWLTVHGVVTPSIHRVLLNGAWTSEGYVDVECVGITLALVPMAELFSLRPDVEQRARALEQALTYQQTLTQRGTVRKRQSRIAPEPAPRG